MTHFARYFKCFRRPDLCPFGNKNNNNKVFLGAAQVLFIWHSLSLSLSLILWNLSNIDVFIPFFRWGHWGSDIKEVDTRQKGTLDYLECCSNLAVQFNFFFITRSCLFREFGEIKIFPKMIGIAFTRYSLTARCLVPLVDDLLVPKTISSVYLKPLLILHNFYDSND